MRALLLLLLLASARAFVIPSRCRGSYAAAPPLSAVSKAPKKGSSKDPEPAAPNGSAFTLESLLTLIQMGAGAPSLGKFKEMDSNGKM